VAKKTAPKSTPTTTRRTYDARPDRADFRDLLYQPGLVEVEPVMDPGNWLALNVPVLDQGAEGSCTGHGLATVINFLLMKRSVQPSRESVSPRMLYEMAKKYDDWPGESYEGSSARGAVKGWFNCGVCLASEWQNDPKNPGVLSPERAASAAKRPLGAYYRVNKKSLTDMHTALTEVGVIYVTSQVHSGWDKVGSDGVIPSESKIEGGHAFVFVGYDDEGFWLQNSWGKNWGYRGLARLSYDDWLRDGDDVWVCRLGVPVKMSK
jgi:C1A family cysteine protease